MEQKDDRQTVGLMDAELFLPPNALARPKIDDEEPFLAPKDWLSTTCQLLLREAKLKEGKSRPRPMAFMRCSRGGKTRTLHEIMLNIPEDYAVIFVSFNDVKSNSDDALQELCDRIGFAALKKDGTEFHHFRTSYRIDRTSVDPWLGLAKCILFIDELNVLPNMSMECSEFLKDNFLTKKDRCFAFSSHIPDLRRVLSAFVPNSSNREIITRPLPLIPSLREARDNFKIPAMSAQEALFLGLIPGLMVEKKYSALPTVRRELVVSLFIDQLKDPWKEVCNLLRTLITGEVKSVPSLLQELMTADVKNGKVIVRWIPYHMVYVLQQIVARCDSSLPSGAVACLNGIVKSFGKFAEAKYQAGEAWEYLFLVVLIVRCLTCDFEENVAPFRWLGEPCVVHFNYPWKNENMDFQKINNPAIFVERIPIDKPKMARDGAAIAIYHPSHAQFEVYDVIVAIWTEEGDRYLYGYQLKEGKAVPKATADEDIFIKSFLVRGQARKETTEMGSWKSVGDDDLDNFFGVSASQWTAKKWKEIYNSG